MDNITPASTAKIVLDPIDTHRLSSLCGELDTHINQLESRLDVQINRRGGEFYIAGANAQAVRNVIKKLYNDTQNDHLLTPDHVHLTIQEALMESDIQTHIVKNDVSQAVAQANIIKTKKCTVKPRGDRQSSYVMQVRQNDINFGIGPAGTGKTYLAVACAVESFLNDEIERILLVRPAVEAGEKLGFLPGDLSQKVDPYLRPLYDALYEMLGFETVGKLIERSVIEVAPLAYMRGRTLNNAFVILDESQNTTREQMKMFLTRIGFGSTAVITGDPSQVDLPRGQASGLKHAMEVLDNVDGISFTYFTSKDVVRHPIVQRIVEAYEKSEKLAEDRDRTRKADAKSQHDNS